MQIYKEYGNAEINNSDVFSRLGYSLAIELLALSSDEKEKFAKEVQGINYAIT